MLTLFQPGEVNGPVSVDMLILFQPGEVNSPVFTDEYIQNIRAEIKRNHFDLR